MGLVPSGSVDGNGNGQRANIVHPYRMCTLICKVQRPRCPVRSLCCRPMRADMESAPTVIVAWLPYGRRGRFHIGPSGASRTPPPTVELYVRTNIQQLRHRKVDRRGQDPSLQYRPPKPPLCKGRWHGVSRDGGIVTLRYRPTCWASGAIPQSASLTAPFTQGSLHSTNYRGILAPEGSIWRRSQKR